MSPIIIDPEFRALIPPLPEESLKHLHNCISAHGCRDKLVVWKKHNILLDGHNRYDFCKANGIPFETVEQFHGDRESAKNWMRINQLGRRNLLPIQFKKITGDLYNSMKKPVGGDRGNQHVAKGQNDLLATSTAETVAAQTGLSPKTVRRAGEFSEAVETLGVSAEVMAGTCAMKPAEIIAKAKELKPKKAPAKPKKDKPAPYIEQADEPEPDTLVVDGTKQAEDVIEDAVDRVVFLIIHRKLTAPQIGEIADYITARFP
jgi:hypothetical protein